MSRQIILFLLLALVISCRKDNQIPVVPETVVRYKLNGNLVEINGSSVYDSGGSRIISLVVHDGNTDRNIYLLEAKNNSEFVRFNIVDHFKAGDSIVYNHPNISGSEALILAWFESKQYKTTVDLGWPPATLTFIIDRISNGTADGRFYGSALNLNIIPNLPVIISEGEFKNVVFKK